MLLCMQKINFITHFFHKILQRKSKFVSFDNLGMTGHTKMEASIWKKLVENFCVYLQAKKQLHRPCFSGYCKNMQTYFGYFEQAWPHTPKMIVSTCRKLLMFICMPKRVFWSITRESEFCQIWDWWWNINNISHFRLFPGQTKDKFFQKNPKKPQIWAKMSFPGKKGYVSF